MNDKLLFVVDSSASFPPFLRQSEAVHVLKLAPFWHATLPILSLGSNMLANMKKHSFEILPRSQGQGHIAFGRGHFLWVEETWVRTRAWLIQLSAKTCMQVFFLSQFHICFAHRSKHVIFSNDNEIGNCLGKVLEFIVSQMRIIWNFRV
jgi:hypothetical protein